MKDTENTFKVLDAISQGAITTQRQLSTHSGVSLGQVNYILKSLMRKGLIKIDNFRKNPNKSGYKYLLTSKGIEAKSRLAVRFINIKLKEYEDLKNRLIEKLDSIQSNVYSNFIFIGPPNVKQFLISIINEKNMKLRLVRHFKNIKDIDNIHLYSYDIALLFDDNIEDSNNLKTLKRIPEDKIIRLW